MKAPSEHQIQSEIVEAIRRGYPGVIVAAVPNGASLCATGDEAGRVRAFRQIAKLKREGLLPGCPDLLLFWPGGMALVECKTPTGALSKEQKALHERLRLLGHRVAIWRSWEDAQADLEGWRVRGGA